MKFEYNGNSFSAEMNETKAAPPTDPMKAKIENRFVFIFGCLSLAFAFVSCCVGLLLDAISDLFILVFGFTTINYLLFSLIACFITIVVSVALGVSSLVCFKKQEDKTQLNTIGFAFSIVAFVMCGLSLLVNSLLLIFL